VSPEDLSRAALRGEPSYIWRAGQQRRYEMILGGAAGRQQGVVLDCGCGVGQFLKRLAESASLALGLEYEPDHARAARGLDLKIVRAAAENLPYPENALDLVLSHEVLEHVDDDRRALEEISRVLRRANPQAGTEPGRLLLFVPNRGYPFETHGIYWRGHYHFGNFPLVNYLPRRWRDRIAPHVRIYTRADLLRLIEGLPLRVIQRRIIFGAYDNIIARWPAAGKLLRFVLQKLEGTAFQAFGLSHFWVLERKSGS
jgi:SAM-dependent methyltransferase